MKAATRDASASVVLTLIAVVSRTIPFGNYAGEPDSALFPIGLWRWIHWGPRGANIYDRQFSPGYYAGAAMLARWLHLGFAHFVPLLNATSWSAAVVTAPLCYAVARIFVRPAPAFWASLLWLVSPAVWWLGLEPHPQGVAIAWLLGSLLCWDRGWKRPGAAGLPWLAAAWACLVVSLLLRCDGVFCLGFYFLLGPTRPTGRRSRRQWAVTAAMLASVVAAFWVARWALLAPARGVAAAGAAEPGAWQQIAGYFGQLSLPHQLLPFITAAGAGALAVSIAGWIRGWRRNGQAWLQAWLLRTALWALPGSAFWVVVRGNNVRHVAFYLLPVLWAGMEGWSGAVTPALEAEPRRRFHRPRPIGAVALVAIAALAFDAGAWPASSNVTLYPSGNVIASVRLLRIKQAEMDRAAQELLVTDRMGLPPACYYGSYSSPYVLLYVLRRSGLDDPGVPQPRTSSRGARTWVWPGASEDAILFHDVYSASEFLAAAASCRRPYSFEYDASGARVWFLGDEIAGPLWRRLRGPLTAARPVLGLPVAPTNRASRGDAPWRALP